MYAVGMFWFALMLAGLAVGLAEGFVRCSPLLSNWARCKAEADAAINGTHIPDLGIPVHRR